MSSRWGRLLLVTLLVGTAFVSAPRAEHAWGPYHWAVTPGGPALQIGDNVNNAWQNHYTKAISDWSAGMQAYNVRLAIEPAGGGTKPKSCRANAGRVEVCNAAYGNSGWLGIAQIWISGGVHITQGIAKMNDTYFTTATYNTPAWRQLVMCQEIAHTFGLGHQDETFTNPNLNSCMDYTNSPASNQEPNAHDFEQLAAIYSHYDTSTTISARLPRAMPPAMGLIDFDAPGQWGQLVRSSAGGRQQVFDLDFGGGHRVVTHVFWADPERDERGRR